MLLSGSLELKNRILSSSCTMHFWLDEPIRNFEVDNEIFMSISQTNQIDLVSQSKKTSEYVLIIVADEPWVDSDEFRYQLQEKLNNYCSYFRDGQMMQEYPACKQQRITVRIDSSATIPKRLLEFISKLSEAIKSYGVDIKTELA